MATITKGKTFISGETVEPADMHQLVDSATVTFNTAADTDDSTLEVSGNKFRVKDSGVTRSKLNVTGYFFQETLYYTSPGVSSFVKATYPWLKAIRVKCLGGGGGGGGAATTGSGETAIGGAGGGGAYAESFITDIAGLDASVTVTVGAGGAGGAAVAAGAAGSNGGTSSFGSLVSASGGLGGAVGDDINFSAYYKVGAGGGTSVTGDFVVQGAPGDTTYFFGTFGGVASANGGNSFLGPGAPRQFDGAGFSAFRGGGGSGAANPQSTGARAGGAGGNGIVIIELYA